MSFHGLVAGVATAVIGIALLGEGSSGLRAAQKTQSYAIIGGTVFQESGFALRGAALTITLKQSANPKFKFKKLDASSDSRGEFAFRVPTVAATYIVKASMKGFQSQEKEAVISGDQFAEAERMDVTLVLPPESK